MKKTIRMYLNGNRDDNYEIGERLGLKDEALHTFSYTLYEVAFDVDLNLETGETNIIKVDDRKLEE